VSGTFSHVFSFNNNYTVCIKCQTLSPHASGGEQTVSARFRQVCFYLSRHTIPPRTIPVNPKNRPKSRPACSTSPATLPNPLRPVNRIWPAACPPKAGHFAFCPDLSFLSAFSGSSPDKSGQVAAYTFFLLPCPSIPPHAFSCQAKNR
jgi:hypothetical protein